MSILSRLTYSLEVKLNIFLQAFEFERRIKEPELQVDALPETSVTKPQWLCNICPGGAPRPLLLNKQIKKIKTFI